MFAVTPGPGQEGREEAANASVVQSAASPPLRPGMGEATLPFPSDICYHVLWKHFFRIKRRAWVFVLVPSSMLHIQPVFTEHLP